MDNIVQAGMTCKLNTRCSVIAAVTSTYGKSYDVYASLTENTGIASPLLSRFDLIILLLDEKNKEWDSKLAEELLQMCAGSNNESEKTTGHGMPSATSDVGALPQLCWSFEELKSYFRMIKSFKPKLTDGAVNIISRYYYLKRSEGCEQSGNKITVRMLESLIR